MAIPFAIRDAFGRTLSRLGLSHSDLVVVDAGCAESSRSAYFAREFPERFVQVGPSPEDLIDTAAGLALCDKVVFACTDGMGACRAFESMRNGPALDRLPVVLFGLHGGLAAAGEGPANQGLEDVALMRAIPDLRVLVPCDAPQTEAVMEWCVENEDGPTYVRLGRDAGVVPATEDPLFTPGRARLLRPGRDICIAACGSALVTAMEAAEALAAEGVDVRVLDCVGVKPLDEAALVAAARDTAGIVTVEEGSVVGGLGSAVCELLAGLQPARVRRLGVPDVFGRSGDPDALARRHGLHRENVMRAVRLLLEARSG